MVTRLNGFSGTGIDIDDTVKKLMAAAKIPQDKLKQQKQSLEWQRDDYRALNATVMDFRNVAFNMKLQSAYQTKKSSVSDDSIISVSASSTAPEGIYSIKVNQLAKAASVTSGSVGESDDKATMSDLGLTGDTTLTVGGGKGTATIQVKQTDTIASLVAAVNGKTSTTGVSMSYDAAIDKFFFVSTSTGANSSINLKMKSLGDNDTQNLLSTVLKLPVAPATPASAPVPDKGQTVTGVVGFANGVGAYVDNTMTTTQKMRVAVGAATVDIDIDKTTTIGKIINAINSSDIGKSGVSAYVDSGNKIAFFNPDDGKAINFTDLTADAVDVVGKLGLGAPVVTNDHDYSQFSATGTKAQIVFNGTTADYDTNTFTVNGMNITLKKEQAAGDTAVSVNNSRDVDAVFNSIKSFIDKYNDLASTVNTKLTEQRYRDFQPLTDEQREAMKEDQIKTWETKAKSGTLRSDALLSSGLQNMRSAFTNTVSGLPPGDLKSLSQIGISSAVISGSAISGSYLENGKIYIDEDKLKKAIAENQDQVMALFNADDGDKNSDSGDGLATRLYDKASALISQITAKAGATTSVESSYKIGKTMKDIDSQINNWTTKLDALQTRYYNQFTAMEKYITQMQAQSAQLSSQFGG